MPKTPEACFTSTSYRKKMKRRDFISGTGAALVGGASASSAENPPRPRRDRPNILLLMADQFRVDCLGAYGNPVIHTPHLDFLARDGVHFQYAYTSTPSCTPARSALLTGLAPWHHGMLGMTRMASRYPVEKPRALADAGYYTTAIGKNHFDPIRNAHGYHQMVTDEHCSYWFHTNEAKSARPEASSEERCDYEAWFWSQLPCTDPHQTGLGWNDYRAKPFELPERLHATQWTGDTAVNFLRTYERPEPFFLKVSFIRPHSPYDPPQRFFKMYEDANLPAAHAGAWASRYEQRSGPDNDIWHGRLRPDEIRRSRQGYYGSVSFVDEQIGRILEALDKRHLMDETLIVFLSDHGDMLGDQNLWRKTYAYEQSAHIPMLMRVPSGMGGSPRGDVISNPVELRDVLPTFMEAAGATIPDHLDGRSLLPLVRGKSAGWRPYIDLEHNICYSPRNHWNGLTDGHWKYIFHAMDGEEQLFHLETDPHELIDLAGVGQHADELRRWRERLVAHLSERGHAFVKGGKLVPRPEGIMLSPNFPGYSARKRA
jgi:arylsulfatase A-like enzyme